MPVTYNEKTYILHREAKKQRHREQEKDFFKGIIKLKSLSYDETIVKEFQYLICAAWNFLNKFTYFSRQYDFL